MPFQNKFDIAIIAKLLIVVVSIGVMVSVAILISTYRVESLGDLDFCFSSSCVEFWSEANKAALDVLSVTGGLAIGLVTVGGIMIALLNYQNSVQFSSVSNHLSHLSIFSNYVKSEASRRHLLSSLNVESLKWYNLAYSDSMSGSLEISGAYIEFVKRLNAQVEKSNGLYQNTSTNLDEKYKYTAHQGELISLLQEIGIYLERKPRIDFNLIEDQALDLLRTVNVSFCRNASIPAIAVRTYN
ncbi:retron Ec48 family effector membrane protein [Ectopseudomonas mendocina]|uniref:retron Ec48 family effector membrane protein n=1 Tax=Ectopseudomonas mendocina TaxID=300 RepID=UPI000F6C72EF|nr:retron Ec48 family effector membrane protein [Pseudomonas mendocina]VEE16343.1 Uncharacterised protein [Pseudomonas mendocina]